MICDLAEVYHILDWRKVPGRTLGALVAGLGPETRIGMELAGIKASPDHILLGRIYDAVNILLYSLAGKKGTDPPESYADKFVVDRTESEYAEFTDGAAFLEARRKLIEGD